MIAAKKTSSIEFRRARSYHNDAASGRTWTSSCGCYRVRESNCLGGCATVYYAQVDVGYWDVISVHRKRSAAVSACERHAKRGRAER